MALIGTISGSVGAGGSLVSSTAISGTLIIADAPASSFPTLASSVKLFVSGNKTSLGADTPNTIFGGDTFVSGAFGTDSYIQMKPVNTLQIPTNTTASYIYTSGSTNDLYFTQYQPGTGYTNTTRLRWLESSLSTGLLHGGVLSTENGTTTFSITSGSGIIISYNASTTAEPYPTIVPVNWPAYVSSSLPNIVTDEITYIAIDSTGALVKQNTAYTDSDFESKIVIGRVLHQNGSVTNGTITSPTVAYGQTGYRGDFIRAFGPLKLSGHVFSVNATATNPPTNTEFLGLVKTAGDSYVEGRNYTSNANSPNYIKSTTDTALTTSKIYREYVNASGVPVIDTGTGTAGYTAIDPNNYNNSGTKTSVPVGNRFTVQRLYWFPNSVNRAIFAYYGSAVYNTIEAAESGISTEAFVEGDNTRDAAIFLGYLIVKQGATNLNSSTDAKLIQAGLSRSIASSGGGGATSPGGSDTYVQYNDAGSFNGASEFRFIESTGTILAANLVVTGTTGGSLVTSGTFQVKDGSGNIVGGISTGGVISGSSDLQIGGNITGSNALLSGDLTVNGGDINSSATTFNFIPSGSTGNTLNIGETTGTIQIGRATGPTTVRLAYGNTTSPSVKTVEIGTNGQAGSTTNITLGSTAGSGRTTFNNDVALTTGNIIGAPGAGANVMTLISSGNLITKIDTDNSAEGHRFAIQDYRNIDQFSVGENGNAELSGSLVITGSLAVNGGSITSTAATVNIANTTPTTVNIANNASNLYLGKTGANRVVIQGNLLLNGNEIQPSGGATGLTFPTGNPSAQFAANLTVVGDLAVNGGDLTTSAASFNLLNGTATTISLGGAATTLNIGGAVTTSSIAGDLTMGGRATLATTIEKVLPSIGGSGTVAFDTTQLGIFYVNNPTGDITANFTNVPTTNNRILTPTVILSQSATARTISAVQIDSSPQAIDWANGVTPVGTANKQDVFGFSLIRSGSAWKVLGQLSTYG